MNGTLFRALVALLPISMLVSGSAVLFCKNKAVLFFLQLLGAGFLLFVVLAHVSEALHLFPWMGWGLEHSAGHYFDLTSAVCGAILFPAGYFLQSLKGISK